MGKKNPEMHCYLKKNRIKLQINLISELKKFIKYSDFAKTYCIFVPDSTDAIVSLYSNINFACYFRHLLIIRPCFRFKC